MGGAVSVFYMRIIFRLLVGVLDYKTNRSSGSFSFKYTRKKLYSIWLFALGDNCRLTGFSLIELFLDLIKIKFNPCRASVNDSPNGFSMGFSKCGKFKYCSEGISGHRIGF